MLKLSLSILVVLIFVFSSGCYVVSHQAESTTPVKAYPGPDLTDEETALVTSFYPVMHPPFSKTSKIGIYSVDGIKMNQYKVTRLMTHNLPVASAIRILEGHHDFIVSAWDDPKNAFRRISFSVKKGHEYEITSHSSDSKWTTIKVQDKNTGEFILERKDP